MNIKYWAQHFADRYIGIPALLVLKGASMLFKERAAPAGGPKRVLLIKFSLMGDTILLYPAVRELKKKYPDSEIDVLCTSINIDIVKKWKEIKETILIGSLAGLALPWRVFALINALRKRNYALALDFEQWFRLTPIIAYLSGAPKRVGFKTAGQHRHYLYTDAVKHERDRHEVECFLDIIRAAGVENPDSALTLPVDQKALESVRRLLEKNNFPREGFVIAHPGCGKNGQRRQWPVERYARILKHITEKYGVKAVLTGSKDDAAAADKIASMLDKNYLNAAGKTTLDELIALVSISKMVICGNSGIMHIASALDKPLIALHGPTNPLKWGPRNKDAVVISAKKDCAPCLYLGFEYKCAAGGCMEQISAAEVEKAFDRLWK